MRLFHYNVEVTSLIKSLFVRAANEPSRTELRSVQAWLSVAYRRLKLKTSLKNRV
uniref:Uncharacterized protein n=1 Tax=Rhizophora mucronata TaxID=61149 RepID=A0A2P2Q6Z2_RHIMU